MFRVWNDFPRILKNVLGNVGKSRLIQLSPSPQTCKGSAAIASGFANFFVATAFGGAVSPIRAAASSSVSLRPVALSITSNKNPSSSLRTNFIEDESGMAITTCYETIVATMRRDYCKGKIYRKSGIIAG